MQLTFFKISIALSLYLLIKNGASLPQKLEKSLHHENNYEDGGRLEERKFDAGRWNFTAGRPKSASNHQHQPISFENYTIDGVIPPA